MKMKMDDVCILLVRLDTAPNRVRILHDDAVASAGGRTRTAQLTESHGVARVGVLEYQRVSLNLGLHDALPSRWGGRATQQRERQSGQQQSAAACVKWVRAR